MSAIFSHALKGLKTNTSQAPQVLPPPTSSDPKSSVLSRIKKNSAKPNFQVIRKSIKKGERKGEGVWRHDLFREEMSVQTVFIRNLPEEVDEEELKRMVGEKGLEAIGVKIEKDTAELNFGDIDTAQKAETFLNGQVLFSKKLKAVLVSKTQTNLSVPNKERKSSFDRKMKIDEEVKSKSILDRIKKSRGKF